MKDMLNKNEINNTITVDGLSATGKSYFAECLARALNKINPELSIKVFDTGILYRLVTNLAINHNLDHQRSEDIETILGLISNGNGIKIEFAENEILPKFYIDGELIEEKSLKTESISNSVQYWAKQKDLRNIMRQLQVDIASKHNLIMVGRDIGTEILPNAGVKLWIEAFSETRVAWRVKNYGVGTSDMDVYEKKCHEVRLALIKRDFEDMTRSTSPAIPARDSIRIHNIDGEIHKLVKSVVKILKKKRHPFVTK